VSTFTFSILLGLGLAVIDVIPMIAQKLPRYSIVASFMHFFTATIIIVHIKLPYIPWQLYGGIIGLVLMIPMLIHIGHNDKKPLPIIVFNAILFGSIAGIATHYME
jgi:hypothetical protein